MGLNHTHVWSPHEVSELAWVRRPLGELDPARVWRHLGGLDHTKVRSPNEVSDLAWVRRPLGELDPARVWRPPGGPDRAESEKLRVFEVGIRNAEVDAA